MIVLFHEYIFIVINSQLHRHTNKISQFKKKERFFENHVLLDMYKRYYIM